MDRSKEELLLEIEKLKEQLTSKEKNTQYGLVWKNIPEAFDKDSENKIPILTEDKNREIKNNDGKPTHIIIEGDNYHALTCLNYTHKGKIDVIYIDPPYNIGNKTKPDFIYKDKRIIDKFPDGTKVPKDHPLRHSYWLSFMKKRLQLAKNILKENGIIVISIDDNEQSNLKLLCDKIFGLSNFIGCFPTIMNLKGNQDQFGFAGTHEYTLIYVKNKMEVNFNFLDIDEEEMEKWNIDEKGYYKKGAGLKRTGENAPREDRPYLFFPILLDEDLKIKMIDPTEYDNIYKNEKKFNDIFLNQLRRKYEDLNYKFILPETKNKFMTWRWSYGKIIKDKDDIIILNNKDISFYKKQRPSLGDLPSKKPKSTFYKPEYSSGNGTNQLFSILKSKAFDNPKPIQLIKDFIKICSDENSIIVDFFAGSGTSGHAVMDLNEQDVGRRQFIICTNNENNIMHDVCYPRISKVISGYENNKGEHIEGLGNSIKYYKTDFIGNNNVNNAEESDKCELARKAGYLLSLTENTLEEIEHTENYQFFENKDQLTAIYFTENPFPFDEFKYKIIKADKKTVVYVLDWGNGEGFYPAFEDVKNIEIKPIPQPILDIYKQINNL